jgi:hypothetical protein
MFKNIFGNRDKKLYKVIYKNSYSNYSDRSYTLLVTGHDPASAIEAFYKKVDGTVKDIVEFTEIKYGSEGAEIKREQK